MNTNTIKHKLNTLFCDRSNVAMLKYLNMFTKMVSGIRINLTNPEEYNWERHPDAELCPFMVEGTGLNVHLTLRHNPINNTFFHDIYFVEGEQKEGINTVPVDKFVLFDETMQVTIKNKTIILAVMESGVCLNRDYDFKVVEPQTQIGLSFDFDKKNIQIIGTNQSTYSSVEDVLKKFKKDYSVKFASPVNIWETAFREVLPISPESELIQEYRLDLMAKTPSIMPFLLYHFMYSPDLMPLLKDAGCARLAFQRLKSLSVDELLDRSITLKQGCTILEMAGLEEHLSGYFSQYGFDDNLRVLDRLKDQQVEYERYQKQFPIKNNEEAQFLEYLLSDIYHKPQVVGYISYLHRCGFEFNEIIEECLKIDREQSIAFEDALPELYKLNFLNDVVNGTRKKATSNCIKLEIDTLTRTVKRYERIKGEMNSRQLVSAVNRFIEDYTFDASGFIFEPYSENSKRQLSLNEYLKFDIMIDFKFEDEDKRGSFNLRGLQIDGVNRTIPVKSKAKIKRWAEKHGINVKYLGLFK